MCGSNILCMWIYLSIVPHCSDCPAGDEEMEMDDSDSDSERIEEVVFMEDMETIQNYC